MTLRAKLVLFLFVAAGGGACSGNLGDGGSGTGAAGASGGSPAVDAGLPPQDGAAGGAAGYGAGGAAGGPQRLHGIHAFDVTTSIDNRAAPVVAVYNPGGLPPNDRVSAPVPTAQTFTLVLDADSGAVIVGTRVRYATTSDGRTFRVQGSFDIDSTTPAISYGDAVLTAVSDGLSGTAVVTVSSQNGFEQAPSVFRLALSSMIGRPDTTPPSFRWFWEGPMDPMRDFDLFAVEAFPPWADVRFESMEGDVIAMFPYFATTPPPLMGDLSAPFFERTPVVLPYGRTFRLVTSSLTDFAGNHAAPLEFNTLPVPPLIAQDGFESATGVIGAGEIVGAAGVPAITGSKSLYLRGRRPDDGCSSGSVSDLVLRLTMPPAGATRIRLSFRTITVTPGVSTVRELAFGSVGGTVGQRSLTGSAPFSTVNLSDGDTASVSAVGTTTIPLPAGTAGELVLAVVGSCPLTQELAGLLIDDLVVE